MQGRLRDAVTDAEDLLKQNPNDLNARRLLARIYARLFGESHGLFGTITPAG